MRSLLLPSHRPGPLRVESGAPLTVLLVLLGIECLAMFGILNEWPVLGEYYEGFSGLFTQIAFVLSCLSLAAWYWINRVTPAQARAPARDASPVISPWLVWGVLAVNGIATLTFGYGSVGYAGTLPFAFLLTAIPLEPLLFARVAQRGRMEPAPMIAYAVLGLLRGWTGHLFVIFIAYLLTSSPRQRRLALTAAVITATLVFEPLMQLRALIRGFDDANGLLVYRLASRIAFTPISDYVLNNIAPVALCGGTDYMAWYQELVFAIVPRALFGVQGGMSVHSCLAVIASGDPATELSFSTTLPIKAALIFVDGPGSFVAFIACVAGIIALQVGLAKVLLGRCWYVYTGIYLYQFFLSGVMRDLAIPTYLLVVMLIWKTMFRHRRIPVQKPSLAQPAITHETSAP